MIKSDKVIEHQDELRRQKRFLDTIKLKFGVTAYKKSKHCIKMANYVNTMDRLVAVRRAMILLYGKLPY